MHPLVRQLARRAGVAAAVLALLATAGIASGVASGATSGTGPAVATPSASGFDLRPLQRGMRGAVVRAVQSSLRLAGYRLPVNGSFGPVTERAVRRFQHDRRLPVTGLVDARTAAELRQVIAVPKLPSSTGSDVRSRIVAIARSQLGQGEHPPGSNCTKFGPCEEWCADFATWVWRQAGVAGIGRIAWVPNLPAWGRSRGRWKPGYNNDPQPGDMVIFSGLHVGLVERVTAGTVTIIAGNTSTNNVARRGPASPARGYAMGPAAISGYVSPVLVGGAARATAVPLPRPTAAQIGAQDPQSRDPRLAAQER